MNEAINPPIVGNQLITNFVNSIWWFLITSIVWPLLKKGILYLWSKWKKSIVLPMKDENEKEIVIIYLQRFVEMCRAMLPVVVFLGVVYTLLFLVHDFSWTYNVKIAIAFVLLFMLVAVSIVVRGTEPNIFGKKHIMLMLILGDLYVLLMLVNFWGHNNLAVYITISVLVLLTYMGVGYGVQNTHLLKKYKYKSVKCMKAIREGIAIVFLALICVGMLMREWTYFSLVVNIYYGCWIAFCIIEWIIIEIKDRDALVNYKIVLSEETIYTQKKVVQRNPAKVKIFLDNGSKRIVDNKEIEYIEFYIKNYFIKKVRHKVVCIPFDGDSKEYSKFNFLNDGWVRFYENHKGGCVVTIMNDARIKEIRVWDKEFA